MKTSFLIKAAAVIVCLACASFASAQTGLTLTLNDGAGHSTNLTDIATPGQILFSGGLAGSIWTANIDIGLSYPILGTLSAPQFELNIQQANSTAAGTLTITLTESGWVPLANNIEQATLAVGGAGDNGNVTASALLNGSPVLTTGALAANPWSTNVVGNVSGFGSTFSIGEKVVVVHNAAGSGKQGDFNLSVVPEPSAFVLVGLGSLGLLAIRRRCS